MKGALLSAALVAALFCYGVAQLASHPEPAAVQVHHDKPNALSADQKTKPERNALSAEQKMKLEQIQDKAAPVLSPKIKEWRKALRDYYKAIENGTVSEADVVQVARAYGYMLLEEIPFREELKSAGIRVNARLQRKNPPQAGK